MFKKNKKAKKLKIKYIAAFIILPVFIFIVSCNKSLDGSSKNSTSSNTQNASTGIKANNSKFSYTNKPFNSTGTANINTAQDRQPGSADAINVFQNMNGTSDYSTNSPEDNYNDSSYNGTNEKKIDFQGETITMITYNGFFLEEESQVKELVLEEIDRCQKEYNFKLNWITKRYSQVRDEFSAAFMAGINYADIFFTNRSYAFPVWVNKNMLVCMDDYINFNNGPYANCWQVSTLWKGKHYGLNVSTINVTLYLMTYNKAILQREGLPDIFQLQQEGKWTWESMLSMAIKTTKDTDGDGIINQWGIDGEYADFLNKLVISNNTDFIKYGNNKVLFNLDDSPALLALQFANELYNIHKVAVPPSLAQNNYFADGKATIYTSYNYDGNKVFPKDCGISFYPKGPNASDYIVATTGGPFMVIPTTVKNPAGVAAVLADIWDIWDETEEEHVNLQEIFNQRISGYVYNANDIVTSNLAAEKLYQLSHMNFGELESIVEGEIYNKIINENIPVVSVIQSFKDRAQMAIDNAEQ